jgi:hypothetical protein
LHEICPFKGDAANRAKWVLQILIHWQILHAAKLRYIREWEVLGKIGGADSLSTRKTRTGV